MKILLTGGAGFIGSSVIRNIINDTSHEVINVDNLTYAGNLESIESVVDNPRYSFEKIDICDLKKLKKCINEHQPDGVMHLAAESHVDRSIEDADLFVRTNIIGTYNLLECSRELFSNYDIQRRKKFRFHHISTDEVYGDLGLDSAPDERFNESTSYDPSSPYSASKASSDHLVRAWYKTYSLPIIITNCSNNYGPYQFPEKLIPLIILNAIKKQKLPIYGDGSQIRDWLFVEDHAEALLLVLEKGTDGETYNIGGRNEYSNLEVVKKICRILDEIIPMNGNQTYESLITFVNDRPGHDYRYAIDSSKIMKELTWQPQETFDSGLRKTVIWYLENDTWWSNILDGTYRLERQGLLK